MSVTETYPPLTYLQPTPTSTKGTSQASQHCNFIPTNKCCRCHTRRLPLSVINCNGKSFAQFGRSVKKEFGRIHQQVSCATQYALNRLQMRQMKVPLYIRIYITTFLYYLRTVVGVGIISISTSCVLRVLGFAQSKF